MSHSGREEETEEAGLWTLMPIIKQVEIYRTKGQNISVHLINTSTGIIKIIFYGEKDPFYSLVLWIIPGFYSLAQTQTLDNVMVK